MPLYWKNYKRHGSRLSLCFTNFAETAIFRVIPLPCRKKYVAVWVKAQPCCCVSNSIKCFAALPERPLLRRA